MHTLASAINQHCARPVENVTCGNQIPAGLEAVFQPAALLFIDGMIYAKDGAYAYVGVDIR
jgi:hypothetical protein